MICFAVATESHEAIGSSSTNHNFPNNANRDSQCTCDGTDNTIEFLQILGTTNTQSKCFVCESPTGRNVLSWQAIRQVWFAKRIYIAKSNRTCQGHLKANKMFTDDALQKIEATKQGIRVKRDDFQLWLLEVSKLPDSTPYDFNDDGIDAELYKTFCGINKKDFDDLVTYLHGKSLRLRLI